MEIYIIRPSSLKDLKLEETDVYIVIDTFRATTTLATLVNSGVKTIYVVKNKSEARLLKDELCNDCLLVGEEEGLKVEGFDYGNTPSDIFSLDLKGQEVIFTSSNGAKTLLLLEGKTQVYLGALTNLSSVSETVSNISKKRKNRIILLPSGYSKSDDYVVEDWVTAVLIASKIKKLTNNTIINADDYLVKTEQVIEGNADIEKLLKDSTNAQKLIKMGFENDVDFAVVMDKIHNCLKVKRWEKTCEFHYIVID